MMLAQSWPKVRLEIRWAKSLRLSLGTSSRGAICQLVVPATAAEALLKPLFFTVPLT